MASPKSKPRSKRALEPSSSVYSQRPASSGSSNPAQSGPPEVVDPIWLLKAVGATILAALLCGYLTLCLLFYQGQWQLVLHPTRDTPAPASIGGGAFQTVHFSVDETATPQLTGWLLPAEPADRYAAYTLLYLPSGDGSLTDAVPTLDALHQIGINVFAFDYRGYGQSAPVRPNQQRMNEDAASAWRYLTVSRALPPSRIVLFGDGVGAALSVKLAAAHPEAAAVVIQAARPNLVQSVLADPRTRSLPVRMLFHENFEITLPVSTLKTPKLFLVASESNDPSASTADIKRLTSSAANPKMVSTLEPAEFNGPVYREQIARFLDEYLR